MFVDQQTNTKMHMPISVPQGLMKKLNKHNFFKKLLRLQNPANFSTQELMNVSKQNIVNFKIPRPRNSSLSFTQKTLSVPAKINDSASINAFCSEGDEICTTELVTILYQWSSRAKFSLCMKFEVLYKIQSSVILKTCRRIFLQLGSE